MKIVGRAAFYLRSVVCWFAVLCAGCLLTARAAPNQTAAPNTSGVSGASTAVPVSIHGIVQLDGPWRFQMGDDPRWADPSFDDSSWPTVTLGKTLADQGFETYAGYAWYRLRIQPGEFHFGSLAGSAPLHLLVT